MNTSSGLSAVLSEWYHRVCVTRLDHYHAARYYSRLHWALGVPGASELFAQTIRQHLDALAQESPNVPLRFYERYAESVEPMRMAGSSILNNVLKEIRRKRRAPKHGC